MRLEFLYRDLALQDESLMRQIPPPCKSIPLRLDARYAPPSSDSSNTPSLSHLPHRHSSPTRPARSDKRLSLFTGYIYSRVPAFIDAIFSPFQNEKGAPCHEVKKLCIMEERLRCLSEYFAVSCAYEQQIKCHSSSAVQNPVRDQFRDSFSNYEQTKQRRGGESATTELSAFGQSPVFLNAL